MLDTDKSPMKSTLPYSGMQAIVSDIDGAKDLNDFEHILGKICENLGFDLYLFSIAIPSPTGSYCKLTITNYQKEWSTVYIKSKYYRIDPALRHCRTQSRPIAWNDLRRPENAPEDEFNRFIDESRACGIYSGISVPLRSLGGAWGLFSMNSSNCLIGSPVNWADLAVAQLFAAVLLDTAYRLVIVEGSSKPEKLTSREVECLHWICAGKTASEVAQILDISESTVIFHLKNIVRKTNALNRLQAAVRASPWIATDPDFFFSSSAASSLLHEINGR